MTLVSLVKNPTKSASNVISSFTKQLSIFFSKKKKYFFKGNVTISSRVDTTDFEPNKTATLTCVLNGIGQNKIENIKWFKDSEQINSQETKLELVNMNHSIHNGNYHCGLTLKNGQTVYSNQINVKIKCIFQFHFSNQIDVLIVQKNIFFFIFSKS